MRSEASKPLSMLVAGCFIRTVSVGLDTNVTVPLIAYPRRNVRVRPFQVDGASSISLVSRMHVSSKPEIFSLLSSA